MKARRVFLFLLVAALLAACESSSMVEAAARQIMDRDGYANAQITKVVEGDAATHGADELYCVATDATTQNGELPYLLVVWRVGDTWDGMQLIEGYYEWDLQGCSR